MKHLLFIFIFLIPIYSSGQENSVDNSSDSIKEMLAFELAQIYAFDQGIRDRHIMKVYSEEWTKIVPAIDSINFSKFIAIIKKYGYPTKALLGEYTKHENVRGVGLVILLHNPKRLIEPEIYDLLKDEVKKGNLSTELFALALDKYYVIYQGKSIYNSQFKEWATLAIKGVSIHDKQLSDSLRMDIGLQPLSEEEFVYEEQEL